MLKLGRSIKHDISYDKRLTHPVREWLIGLACFTAIIALGSAKGVYDFLTYQNEDTTGGTFAGTVVRYNDVEAKQALSRYRARKDAYDALQGDLHGNASSTFGFGSASSTAATSSKEAASSSAAVLNAVHPDENGLGTTTPQ